MNKNKIIEYVYNIIAKWILQTIFIGLGIGCFIIIKTQELTTSDIVISSIFGTLGLTVGLIIFCIPTKEWI